MPRWEVRLERISVQAGNGTQSEWNFKYIILVAGRRASLMDKSGSWETN